MMTQFFDWLSRTLLWVHNGSTKLAELDFEDGTIWVNGTLQLSDSNNRPVSITATPQQINALSGLIDTAGDITLTNTMWEDLRFPAAGINPPGAGSDPTRDTTDGRLIFSGSADNIIAIQAQMPHAWKYETAIHPHIHWSPTTTDTAAVHWKLQYKIANINGTFPGSWTADTIVTTPSGVVDKHELDSFADIDMTGYIGSAMMMILLTRLGSTDPGGETVKLNEFDIHYEVNKLGSPEEIPSS